MSTTPFCGLNTAVAGEVPQDAIAVVLGAGTALGSAHAGTENGPFFLRTVSRAYTWSAKQPVVFDLRHGLAPLGRIVDLGDLDFAECLLTPALALLEQTVAGLPPDVVPGVIGGDHTVTLPVVAALLARASRPFSVVQFDHHLDVQTWGSIPDCPRDPVFNTNVMSHVSDLLGPGRLIQAGISPYVTVEADSAAAVSGFLHTVGRQVCLPSLATDEALAAALVGCGDVYVTVDVDVLDSTEMSATGYPAVVGLSTRRLLRLIDVVLEHNRLIGFDVVEFAADRLDRSSKTLADAQRATMIFLHLLGWVAKQASSQSRTSSETPC